MAKTCLVFSLLLQPNTFLPYVIFFLLPFVLPFSSGTLLFSKWQTQKLQKCTRFLFVFRAGHKGNVHPLHFFHFFELNLRKYNLLLNAQGVIAVLIKARRRKSAKIPDSRHGHIKKPIEKLVHPS